jgi:dTDP-4-dehydrorhamnose reductase
VEVREHLKEHFILRTGWVYGVHGHNFVKTMLRLGREREEVQVVTDQYGCPTYAVDLAETILRIAAQFLQGGRVHWVHWGTYHYCGKGVTSWHGFAEEIFRLASGYESLKVKRVEPVSTSEYPTAAKRPTSSILDCSVLAKTLRPTSSILDCSVLAKTFNIHPQPWAESLANMLEVLFSAEKSKNPHRVMT